MGRVNQSLKQRAPVAPQNGDNHCHHKNLKNKDKIPTPGFHIYSPGLTDVKWPKLWDKTHLECKPKGLKL